MKSPNHEPPWAPGLVQRAFLAPHTRIIGVKLHSKYDVKCFDHESVVRSIKAQGKMLLGSHMCKKTKQRRSTSLCPPRVTVPTFLLLLVKKRTIFIQACSSTKRLGTDTPSYEHPRLPAVCGLCSLQSVCVNVTHVSSCWLCSLLLVRANAEDRIDCGGSTDIIQQLSVPSLIILFPDRPTPQHSVSSTLGQERRIVVLASRHPRYMSSRASATTALGS